MMLYDRLSIDIWKVIADKIQTLEMYSFNDEEFNENLIKLREMLLNSNISLDYLRRYPLDKLDIGLSSLLQSIYSTSVFNDYKKANFYEKIYQIDDLGISSIQFRPVDFPGCVEGISLIKDSLNNIIGINNCFTDGEFKIGYPDSPLNRKYDMFDLKGANYIINILVYRENRKNIINQDESYIVLKSFDGVFPYREEVYDIRYPGLGVYSRYLDDGRKQFYLKQLFYPMDRDDVNYPKRLVKMKDIYHYE